MKLPSITQVIDGARQSFTRFPLVLIAAAIGTVCGILLIENNGVSPSPFLPRTILVCGLAVVALLAVAITCEKRRWSPARSLGAQALFCVLLAAYWFTLPGNIEQAPTYHFYRYGMLMLGMIMALAVLPYITSGDQGGFWQYNRTLFFRLLVGGIYSAVLWIGLSAALAAIDNLLGVKIDAKRYGELWVLIAGLFNTWFFVAGVPTNFDELSRNLDYPKGLKIFAQYILSILVVAYFLILYAYIIKIVVQWNWPKGWVSALITGYSAVGIGALLFLWPIQHLAENKWVKTAWRWFFVFHVPLVVVLIMAIFRRTSEYGLTIDRYIVLTFAYWLAAITLYYLISKRQSIKFLVISLGVVALGISFGPWGAFSLSASSQEGRLRAALERNHMLVEGKATKAETEVSTEDCKEISSIIDYFNSNFGYDDIQPLFDSLLVADSARENGGRMLPSKVVQLINIEYIGPWGMGGRHWIYCSAKVGSMIQVSGFDHLIRHINVGTGGLMDTVIAGVVLCRMDSTTNLLHIMMSDSAGTTDTINVDLTEVITASETPGQNYRSNEIPADSLALVAESSRIKGKIFINSLSGEWEDRKLRSGAINFDLLYSYRKLD
ncbi:MAG: DUF4153 domain-containing protein [Candidatus Zixiibacteriota bacterium]